MLKLNISFHIQVKLISLSNIFTKFWFKKKKNLNIQMDFAKSFPF
jgi:hypothetical protein